jgi:hypothetical protein
MRLWLCCVLHHWRTLPQTGWVILPCWIPAVSFHQLSRYRHKEALVLMAFDANCAAMPAAVNELEARNEVWQEQGVAVALINASANQDLDKVA